MTIWAERGALRETVQALLSGRDSLDLEALYRAHHRLVWWIVRGSGVPESAVEDVVQDVFIAAYRRRAMAPRGDQRRWLVGVARSVGHAYRRSLQRQMARVAQFSCEGQAPALDDALEERRTFERVHETLAAMPYVLREAFVLVEWHGATPAEVAHMLGISRNTVYSRVRLAKARLAAVVEPQVLARVRPDGPPSQKASRRTWGAIVMRLGWRASIVRGAVATVVLGIGIGSGVGLHAALPRERVATRERESVQTDASAVIAAAFAPPVHTSALDERAEKNEESALEERTEENEAGASAKRAAEMRKRSRERGVSAQRRPKVRKDTRDEEARLLHAAMKNLNDDDLERGDAALREHARRYPKSVFTPQRQRLERKLVRLRGGSS